MMLLVLESSLREQLRQLYEDMETAYDATARKLGHSCDGCPDNCCDSYFQHHTYIEWSYLWYGLERLSPEQRRIVVDRAAAYEKQCETALRQGARPQVMCPLNESGRCMLYQYRLMVCRTHGVPARMTRPDGKELRFPGCFRCQEAIESNYPDPDRVPCMERTALLTRLVNLEQQFLDGKRHIVPRVKSTIAQMLIAGPPAVAHCSDGKTGFPA